MLWWLKDDFLHTSGWLSECVKVFVFVIVCLCVCVYLYCLWKSHTWVAQLPNFETLPFRWYLADFDETWCVGKVCSRSVVCRPPRAQIRPPSFTKIALKSVSEWVSGWVGGWLSECVKVFGFVIVCLCVCVYLYCLWRSHTWGAQLPNFETLPFR